MLILPEMKEMIRKNIFSVAIALIIMYLSLASSDSFDRVSFFDFPGFDKVVHSCMYFALMSVIILEHKIVNYRLSKLFLVSLIPLIYGSLMEVGQSIFTVSRSASFLDILANLAGILVSVFSFTLYKRRNTSSVKK